MPTVKVVLNDQTYRQLVRARRQQGVPSVAAYLLFKAGVLDDTIEAQEIVTKAMVKASTMDAGCSFLLRDLFPSAEWTQFTKGARVRAGRMFYERASEALDGIAIGRKGAGNHQLYFRRRPKA